MHLHHQEHEIDAAECVDRFTEPLNIGFESLIPLLRERTWFLNRVVFSRKTFDFYDHGVVLRASNSHRRENRLQAFRLTFLSHVDHLDTV